MRKAGLIIAILPIPFLLVYAVSRGLNEYYGFSGNLLAVLMFSMPCLLVTAVSWRWPLRGGAVAAGLSVIAMLVYVVMGLLFPEYPANPLAFTFLALLALSLIGSLMVFFSAKRTSQTPKDFSNRRTFSTLTDYIV